MPVSPRAARSVLLGGVLALLFPLAACSGPDPGVGVARYDSQCVLVMKNANSEKSQQISMSVTSKSAFSLRRLIGSIPLLKNLVQTDHSESD